MHTLPPPPPRPQTLPCHHHPLPPSRARAPLPPSGLLAVLRLPGPLQTPRTEAGNTRIAWWGRRHHLLCSRRKGADGCVLSHAHTHTHTPVVNNPPAQSKVNSADIPLNSAWKRWWFSSCRMKAWARASSTPPPKHSTILPAHQRCRADSAIAPFACLRACLVLVHRQRMNARGLGLLRCERRACVL